MTLPLKPFDQMTEADYAKIGFKCGLEVHRQLLTETKLFCRCPAGRLSNSYDAEILRHMRPTLSELGEYDGTALMEKKTKKNIYYRIHRDTVCTYEFDDTPPFFMNDQALDIAIEISLLLRLHMVGELHIARKQYLDGSIPAGFQRTTILGVDGWIPYKDRRIRIAQLGLEEDSCREFSDIGHERVCLTDRLGTPLIEVVTYPDMRTPQEAADVCRIIRMLCRSTGKVRTGYGAARQDVNVSVEGGTRVEIKGVPQIWRMPRLIYNEATRQCSLLRIRDELRKRGITPDSFETNTVDVTRIVLRTRYEPMRSALSQGHRVKCVALKGFSGVLNEPTQENTMFAKEFSDRVRVIACLSKLPNIVHSDTASESLYGKDWQQIRKKMDAGRNDCLILVWGNEADTQCACNEIIIRAREATVGVPSDTRQGFKDGTNGFERVLPGAERMYPDTDLPPIALESARLDRIKSGLPEFVWDRQARFTQMGLPDDVIFPLCVSGRGDLFCRIVDELNVDPTFAAVVLCQRFKAFRRSGLNPDRLTDQDILAVFIACADGRLIRGQVVNVFRRILEDQHTDRSPSERAGIVLDEFSAPPADEKQLSADISEVVRRTGASGNATTERKLRCMMGRLMKKWRGCVEGHRVADLLRQELGDDSESTTPETVQA